MSGPVLRPTLRADQQKMVAEILAHFRAGVRAVLAIAPTGSGKGEIIRHLAVLAAGSWNKKVLVAVHLGEIVRDVATRIRKAAPGLTIRVLMGAETDGPEDADITVASWQTLHARAVTLPVDLVIADEAHRTLSRTVLEVLARHTSARLLGFTATGQRASGVGLGDVGYQQIVQGPQIRELVAAGHLAPVRIIAPDDPTDHLAWEPADAWMRWANQPTDTGLVFACGLEDSRAYAAQLRDNGVSAVHVDSDVKKADREAALHGLASGTIQVLTNFRLFTDGLNVRRINVVMLASAFSHDGPYLQSVGRGRRDSPETGKTRLTLLDLRGNRWRRGHPDAERVYSLAGAGCSIAGGLEPLPACRQCPACLAWVDAQRCPDCGCAVADGRKPARVVRAELHEQTAAREAARLARQDGLARTGPDWDLFLSLVAKQAAKGKAHTAAFMFKLRRGRPPRWRVAHALEVLGLSAAGDPHAVEGMR